jgi:hypothetical protein
MRYRNVTKTGNQVEASAKVLLGNIIRYDDAVIESDAKVIQLLTTLIHSHSNQNVICSLSLQELSERIFPAQWDAVILTAKSVILHHLSS